MSKIYMDTQLSQNNKPTRVAGHERIAGCVACHARCGHVGKQHRRVRRSARRGRCEGDGRNAPLARRRKRGESNRDADQAMRRRVGRNCAARRDVSYERLKESVRSFPNEVSSTIGIETETGAAT